LKIASIFKIATSLKWLIDFKELYLFLQKLKTDLCLEIFGKTGLSSIGFLGLF
jgi:hypothetical protein